MNVKYILALATATLLQTSCALFQDTTNVTTIDSPAKATATKVTTKNKSKSSTTTTKPKTKSNKKQKSKKNKANKAYYVPANNQTDIETITLTDQSLNGEWTIIEVNDQKIEGEDRPYIYFEVAGTNFYGSNGCNTINGQYAIDGNSITMSNILTTQKACHDAPYEYLINYALSQVATFAATPSGNEYLLNLYDKNKVKILVLRKHNMDYLNGHWQVIKINDEKCDNDKMQLVIDIPELKLHGNTGCNLVNGQLLIDPDKQNSIQFHQLISTRMACPDQNQELELLVALEEVESAMQENNGNKILMFNKKGKEVLQLQKIER